MKKFILAASLLFSFPALAQNYQATQGAGTTFGTKLVGGVNYPQFNMCDPTTPANCVAVDASGRVTVLQGTSPWVVSNSGTFATQATQAGTWTVQPGNTANTTAWLVTGTGGTFPATQSGAWTVNPTTAANWAIAATAAAVPANAHYWGINVGGNLTGVTGLSIGTARAPTVAIVDASGNQITSFGGSGGTASNYGSAFPSSGTAAGFTDGTNMAGGRVGAVANLTAATGFLDSLGICQYLATPPTITDTRFNQIQCNVNGSLRVEVSNSNANGQATMTNSSPVVIASNQSAVPISIASAQVASGAYASGSFSSGAFASGSYASGAFATGSMVDFLTTVGSKNAGTAAASAQLAAGVYNSTPLTLTNTQQSSLQLDANGYLKVNTSTAPATGLPTTPGTLAGGATFVSGTTAAMTGTTSTQVIALVSSQRIYVTRIACKGDPANAVATKVQIRDGVAGTILDTLTVAASGGGEQATGSTPLFWTTSGTALYAQNVTTASSVICTASGYSG